MTRRIPGIPALPTLSFLLLVTVVTLWARSPRHADVLAVYTPAGHLAGLSSDHKVLLLCGTDVRFDPAMSMGAETMSMPADEFASVHDLLFDPSNQKQHLLGFRWAAGKLGTWPWSFSAVMVPYWALVIPLAVLPLRGFRSGIVRQRRKRRGQCLVCGYDLRQTSDRCPECGTPIRAAGGTMGTTGLPVWRRLPAGAFSWLLLGVLIAACTSAVVRGGRAAASAASAPPEQAVLGRVVGPIDLRNSTLLQSVTAVARAGNTRVQLSGISATSASDHMGTRLTLSGVNLELALRLACEEWSHRQSQPLELWASRPVVRIAPAAQAPRFLRSYPVAQILMDAQSQFDRDADEEAARPDNSQQGVSNTLFAGSRFAGERKRDRFDFPQTTRPACVDGIKTATAALHCASCFRIYRTCPVFFALPDAPAGRINFFLLHAMGSTDRIPHMDPFLICR